MSADDKKMFGAAPHGPTEGMSCARCEALLMDAMDGKLPAEEKAAFDLHLHHCTECARKLEEGKRGMAWLQMLRQAAPEPSDGLVNRILLATSGVPFTESAHGAHLTAARVLPFRVSALKQRMVHYGRVAAQPRLAMTAAMAFFSIAVTLNLFGVHVTQLRASDLKPANLRRTFWRTNQSVVRYYDNLRVVYELQSRVRELRDDHPVPESAPKPPNPQNDTRHKNKDGKGAGGGSSLKQPRETYRNHPVADTTLLIFAEVQKGALRREDLA
ncbi:MAG: zf-HC2 domain-containing protein [Acidobacteria bacterium]|nr:zf-HC2 domain-containing protein [Acidobacteriota bacterium]